MRITLMVLFIVFTFTVQANCDTKIYTWTDENGVKQFSDKPPENISEYEIIKQKTSKHSSPAGSRSTNDADNGTRDSYERMIKEVQRENKRTEEIKARQDREEQAKQAQEKKSAQEKKKQTERDRLQKQIDTLNSRALSPTFTKGMRDNQIKAIQEKIDAIK